MTLTLSFSPSLRTASAPAAAAAAATAAAVDAAASYVLIITLLNGFLIYISTRAIGRPAPARCTRQCGYAWTCRLDLYTLRASVSGTRPVRREQLTRDLAGPSATPSSTRRSWRFARSARFRNDDDRDDAIRESIVSVCAEAAEDSPLEDHPSAITAEPVTISSGDISK